MSIDFDKIFKILNLAERLKFELRHSWLSNGRRESVAEHVWRVSLMAMLCATHLQKKVDLEKTLKMIIIHDLVEAEAGDVPIFEAETPECKREKMEKEKLAIEHIKGILNNEIGDEIYTLWHEFEEKETYEAKFAQALDKLEAQLQHIEADLNTWIDKEKLRIFYKLDPYCEFDPFFVEFKERLKEQAITKMQKAGIDTHALHQAAKLDLKS